jgi:uncharacterized protein YjbI with pentapeptide repeats
MKRAILRGLQSDGHLFMGGVDLSDAVLQQADLHSVNFGRSNLSGEDLSRANPAGAVLRQVTHNRTVKGTLRLAEAWQSVSALRRRTGPSRG